MVKAVVRCPLFSGRMPVISSASSTLLPSLRRSRRSSSVATLRSVREKRRCSTGRRLTHARRLESEAPLRGPEAPLRGPERASAVLRARPRDAQPRGVVHPAVAPAPGAESRLRRWRLGADRRHLLRRGVAGDLRGDGRVQPVRRARQRARGRRRGAVPRDVPGGVRAVRDGRVRHARRRGRRRRERREGGRRRG